MKLKTLKDIATAFVNGKNEIRGVREDELKAEAVKWVKDYRNNSNVLAENSPALFDFMIDRWLQFFNITEEDLKQLS